MRNALLTFALLLSTASASAHNLGKYNPYKDEVLTEAPVCMERKSLDDILSYIGASVQLPEGDYTRACFSHEIKYLLLVAFNLKLAEDLSESLIEIRRDIGENRMKYMCLIRDTLQKSNLGYATIGMTPEEWEESKECKLE